MFRVRLFLKSTPATPAGANQDAPSSYSELVDADDNGLRHQVAVPKHQVGNSNVAEASADCGRLSPNEGLVMGLTERFRREYSELWEQTVAHPFVIEMGRGSLPTDKFKAYFLQDYLFLRHLVSFTALGIAKAPDLERAHRLDQFLSGILDSEHDLFARVFKDLGLSEEQYMSAEATPTTQAFGDFIVRTGLEGDFHSIITALYVTEGTYLDWAARLLEQGERPSQPMYQEWINIHGPDVLGNFVDWLRVQLDSVPADTINATKRVFNTTLRYEYLFWEAAYQGDLWPDQR